MIKKNDGTVVQGMFDSESDTAITIRTPPENVTGYSIVQADSRLEVERLFEDHPHFKAAGGSIDLFEFLSMPGM